LEPNRYNAYSENNTTAKKMRMARSLFSFGSCDGKIPYYLPTMPGWNYTVRFFRPRAEALNGMQNSRRRSA
jgi:hypothetical protein